MRTKEFALHIASLEKETQSFLQRHKGIFLAESNLWIKGGAARKALLAKIGKSSVRPPRDFDLVFLTKDPRYKREIAEEICELFDGEIENRDVEIESSILDYFQTRDFGINEVLLRPERMIATEKAIRDAKNFILSPSSFEHDLETKHFGGRIALKGIFIALSEGLSLAPICLRGIHSANSFELLVTLFKAFQVGVEDSFFSMIKSALGRREKSAESLLISLTESEPNFNLTDKQKEILKEARKISAYE